jgi:hypothetical protein
MAEPPQTHLSGVSHIAISTPARPKGFEPVRKLHRTSYRGDVVRIPLHQHWGDTVANDSHYLAR